MYTISINNKTYEVSPQNGASPQGTINGVDYAMDMAQKDASNWIVNKDGKEYRVEVADLNTDEKTAILRINGRKYNVQLKDQFDQLLKDLGLENMAVKKVSEIKSPMPGLVLDVLVEPGDQIKKGDQVLILEAMKMENVIKSQSDATVKSVRIEKGVAVEKSQILVEFE
ncbi:acetyl-CoA carboxylase biotin carboxyl carrier protein subunit [bacterium SCSIO 12643]|nr:acetyl-CoA carboxylase biotin carboxyl carrier protein subunit [bacterium SCSIO 12643]